MRGFHTKTLLAPPTRGPTVKLSSNILCDHKRRKEQRVNTSNITELMFKKIICSRIYVIAPRNVEASYEISNFREMCKLRHRNLVTWIASDSV